MGAIDDLLVEVKTATRCSVINGDVLPLPQSASPDKLTLVVNCFYGTQSSPGGAAVLVPQCRTVVGKALDSIATFIQRSDIEFDIVGVSIFWLDDSGEYVRAYWANSRKDLLSESRPRIVAEGSQVFNIQ